MNVGKEAGEVFEVFNVNFGLTFFMRCKTVNTVNTIDLKKYSFKISG